LEICLFAGCTIAGVSLELLFKPIWIFIIIPGAVLLLHSYAPGISIIITPIFRAKSETASLRQMPSKRKGMENKFTK